MARDGTLYFQNFDSVFALSNTGSLLWSFPDTGAEGGTGADTVCALALNTQGDLITIIADARNVGRLYVFPG